MPDELFDEPSRWRLEAAEALGLTGDDLVAGLVTGAGYPAALDPVVDALHAGALVADVGAGLGAASAWLARSTGARVVAIEPEPTSARAARRAFPSLPALVAPATPLPVATGSCGAVTLLGVVSLVEDLDPVLDDAVRVLADDGCLAISDLCRVAGSSDPSPGSPNEFRTADELVTALEDRGLRIVERQQAPANRSTEWDAVGQRVDDEVRRAHDGEPALDSWLEDRSRLRDRITAGELEVATIVAAR